MARRALQIAGLAVMAAVGMVLVWWWGAERNPYYAPPPAPALPVPNAYDAYVALAPLLVPEHISDPLARRDAWDSMQPAERIAEADRLEALLAPACRAMSFEYHRPSLRSVKDLERFPDPPVAQLGRRFAFIARTRAAQRRWEEANASALGAVQLGAQTLTGSRTTIGAIDSQRWGRQQAWLAIEQLPPEAARASVRRMEHVLELMPEYGVLSEEMSASDLALCASELRRSDWRSHLWLKVLDDRGPDPPSEFFAHKRRYFAARREYSDQMLERDKRPWASRGALPALPRDPWLAYSVQVADHADIERRAYERARAANRMLLLAYALRAFRAEHRSFPATLDALVRKGYIRAIPADPFGTGSLVYRRIGDTYLLYSVGPDSRDDGGVPLHDGPGEVRDQGDFLADDSRSTSVGTP